MLYRLLYRDNWIAKRDLVFDFAFVARKVFDSDVVINIVYIPYHSDNLIFYLDISLFILILKKRK